MQLKVYSLQGVEMANIAEGYIDAGETEFDWDATGVAPGIYFFRLTTGTQSTTGKINKSKTL